VKIISRRRNVLSRQIIISLPQFFIALENQKFYLKAGGKYMSLLYRAVPCFTEAFRVAQGSKKHNNILQDSQKTEETFCPFQIVVFRAFFDLIGVVHNYK